MFWFLDKSGLINYDLFTQISPMKAERVILSFIAVLVGLMVAGGAYYLYQHYTKPAPTPTQTITIKPTAVPSPTMGNAGDYITIDQPADESVFTTRSLTVSGKATKDSTVIVSTPSTDQVGVTSADGTYSLTITLDDDTNPLYVTAIFPDGSEQRVTKTVTYSTASF